MNRTRLLGAASIAAALAAMAPEPHAAQRALDPTFGQGGRVDTHLAVPFFPDFFPLAESVLVQPDGKILVCGWFWQDGVSYVYGMFLVRFLRDGTLDPEFGVEGKVAVVDPGFPYDTWSVGADMALQADGKIVLIGQDTLADGIVVHRYTPSGMLDTTFGDNGRATVPRPSVFRATEGTSIALQSDGRIVGVGWEYELTQPYYDAIVVFRLNEDGSMDEDFGPDGTGVIRIVNGYDEPQVLVQSDGRILVAGVLLNFSTIRPTPVLARYNNDGSLDSGFGNSGMITDKIGGLDSSISSAAVQPDGKIIAVGRIHSASGRSFAVRYDSDGSLDPSFGTDGVLFLPLSFLASPRSVALTADRKIVAIGDARRDASGDRVMGIIRLTYDGALDPGFGIGGRLRLPILQEGAPFPASVSDVAIQQDGRMLVAGHFVGEKTITVIRVNPGTRSGRSRRDSDPPSTAPPN